MSRLSLLMDGLNQNPAWVDFVNVYESVWGISFNSLVQQLANNRDLFQYMVTDDSPIRTFSDYTLPDRDTCQRLCALLGFTYPDIDASLFSTEDYLRIAQNLGAYYQEQGTDSFLLFFSFCLNFVFSLSTQWTQDYVTFVSEGDPSFGVPVWNGGSWYPTSHVAFSLGLGSTPPANFVNFFNYIAPINLVLMAIQIGTPSYISDNLAVYSVMTVQLSNQSA